ncbi:MAG TPA: excinuclease ABC subunit UvrB [Patescibacteria group bacterium]|nr:excinuclease ABC subunit UvrB [Patescibacteria group bacterium]
MNKFKIQTDFKPTGDQPEAIAILFENLQKNVKHQTLWGVTGSGKTYTMANVIEKVQRPTLVIAHNKTLAAQLADEFRSYFPDNAVHYFVSYYDYYQPEAYLPHTDTYIEKDSSINDEIDRLRHAATHALLTRSDVIIVASVSCIYGLGSPEFYRADNFSFQVGEKINRSKFLHNLNTLHYDRNDIEIKRGTYRLKGDVLEILPAYANNSVKVDFFGDRVDKITETDWISGQKLKELTEFEVFPATHFMTPPDVQKKAIEMIKADLNIQIAKFDTEQKPLEAERIAQRTNFDLEMIEETGSCSGIENYSRYFDGRKVGDAPTTLMDYFPEDFMLFIDESHMTVPQIRGMYAGDFSRKEKLINYGFRLPSAFDNRPLQYREFYKKINQVVFVSATPAPYEIEKSSTSNIVKDHTKSYDAVIRQFIRPTGLLDPTTEIRQTKGQIEDLILEIQKNVIKGQRSLVTTLTKKIAEELTDFLIERGIKVAYIHSDVPTLERLEILHKLRLGKFDVLVGINLLREGLDLPEVSLVAILDADKEGFLRSKTALVQTMGRAARHSEGRVILYADVVTDSIKAAILETDLKRQIQTEYNQKHSITPTSISKTVAPEIIEQEEKLLAIDRDFRKLPAKEKRHAIISMRKQMIEAANSLQFERAAELRDQILFMEKK